MSNRELSILQNLASANIADVPYPHVVIPDALPAALFARLEAEFPDEALLRDGREAKETWFDYPACKVLRNAEIGPTWRSFFDYHVSADFFREFVGHFGDRLRALYPDLERRAGRYLEDFDVGMRPGGRGNPLAPGADASMECQFYLNYTRGGRTVRGPHVDRPTELFAALLYFRDPADESSGGDLEICRAREPQRLFPTSGTVRIDRLPAEIDADRVQATRTVKYAPNTLVLFLNSPRSIHAVTPRTPTAVTRRHINFCADMRFDLFTLGLPPRLRLAERMGRMPVVWRWANRVANAGRAPSM